MTQDPTDHDDYEPAFQAAEQAAQQELGCGVDPTPLATEPHDGWHTWAFEPLGDDPTTQNYPATVERVEVQLEAEDTDGNVPVHFTLGPPAEPTIIDSREVGGA